MTLDLRDMSLRGKIGGYARAAKYAASDLTGPARRGFLARFEPSADLALSPEERERRTAAALRAHMARLARLSAKARRR